VSFVGSTATGKHVYSTAAAAGKRAQALTEAKNHTLVLRDAPVRPTAARIVNSAFGCAGERCMALPVASRRPSPTSWSKLSSSWPRS
jgi:malonate-semialdehyde dehydrogenase (acetylating)/methylmalonate-semialdehyde dehydrogenase